MAQQITKSIIIKANITQAYGLWSNVENFPHFMEHIKLVEKTGPTTSRWIMAGPAGMQIDWQAELTRQELNKRLAWSSKDHDGLITTSGQVTFNALSQTETEVTVVMSYTVPGGKVGEVVASWFAEPEERLTADLRRFKTFAEAQSQAAIEVNG
jgi:uncharacterized membrane protein